jgi:hypothetical protein
MESGGIYSLIVLFLSIITSYYMITDINDDENRIWVIIGNRSVYGGLFYETLDIHEYFLLRVYHESRRSELRWVCTPREIGGEPRDKAPEIMIIYGFGNLE